MSHPSDLLMIDAQAKMITKLNKTLEEQGKLVNSLQDRLAARDRYAQFYRMLQDTILANPMLAEEWQSFLVLAKLVDPDESKYHHI